MGAGEGAGERTGKGARKRKTAGTRARVGERKGPKEVNDQNLSLL